MSGPSILFVSWMLRKQRTFFTIHACFRCKDDEIFYLHGAVSD